MKERNGFLDDLQFKYGNIDLLSRFLKFADLQNRERGVVTSFASLDELLVVNIQNRDSWLPLLPTFDPTYNTFRPNYAFAMLGRNAAGEVVSAQAARLFDWRGSNFQSEAETLRIFYSNPEKMKRRGETCKVVAPSASEVSGLVAFLGAVWYRPDYRKKMPTLIDLRIAPICARTMWRPDYFVWVMGERLANKGLAPRTGHKPEWGLQLTNNVVFGDAEIAVLQMTYDASEKKFLEFLAQIGFE